MLQRQTESKKKPKEELQLLRPKKPSSSDITQKTLGQIQCLIGDFINTAEVILTEPYLLNHVFITVKLGI